MSRLVLCGVISSKVQTDMSHAADILHVATRRLVGGPEAMSDDPSVPPLALAHEVERLRGVLGSIVAYGQQQVDLEVERGLEGAARPWRHIVHVAEQALNPHGEHRTN